MISFVTGKVVDIRGRSRRGHGVPSRLIACPPQSRAEKMEHERAVGTALAALLAGSAIRVGLAFSRAERLNTEVVAAVACLLIGPWMLWRYRASAQPE